MNELQEFLERVLPISGYHVEQPIFVITTDDEFFESVRAVVNNLCVAYQESQVTEDDMDVHEVEPVRVIRIQGNDIYTPRGYTSIGCIVHKGVDVTDGCLKCVTMTLMTHFPGDPRQGFLELDL